MAVRVYRGVGEGLTFSEPRFLLHLTPIDALGDGVLLCKIGFGFGV